MKQRSLFDVPSDPPSFTSQLVTEAEDEGTSELIPLSSLAPNPVARRYKGIARMASEAVEIDERNEVEYRDLPCRSLLSPCDSQRVPFDFTINPYRGCEFGCVYCYARYTHEYMEFEDWLDFERKVFVKRGAREALLNDLKRLDLRGKWIALGAATDPYQPAERRYGITRSVLEVLAGRRNLHVSITTKSDLVARDLDLLQRIAEHSEIHVNVTITTPRYELSRRIEPRAPRPDKRFGAVEKLAAGGITAGVFLMPLLPRINDRLEDLEALVKRAKEVGASYLGTQVLFLRKCSKKRFFPFIEERFPDLLPYYQRLYASHQTEALTNYTQQITTHMRRLKQMHGLMGLRRDPAQPNFAPDQLALGVE